MCLILTDTNNTLSGVFEDFFRHMHAGNIPSYIRNLCRRLLRTVPPAASRCSGIRRNAEGAAINRLFQRKAS